MKGIRAMVAVAAGVLCLAAGVQAAPGQGPGKNDKEPRGQKGACLVKCVRDMHSCLSAARTEFKLCRVGCVDERATVREACADDSGDAANVSEACKKALDDLKVCMDVCHDGYKTDLRACHEASRSCARKCIKPEAQ